MGSDQRRRDKFLPIRLSQGERDYLDALVAAGGGAITRADIARHRIFGTPLPTRPQCSPKHGANCTAAHAEQVHGYRWERDRQEQQQEAATGGYAGDAALPAENDAPPLITFRDWLDQHNNHGGHHQH